MPKPASSPKGEKRHLNNRQMGGDIRSSPISFFRFPMTRLSNDAEGHPFCVSVVLFHIDSVFSLNSYTSRQCFFCS